MGFAGAAAVTCPLRAVGFGAILIGAGRRFFGAGTGFGVGSRFGAAARFGVTARRLAAGFAPFLTVFAGAADRRLAGAAFFLPEVAALREAAGLGAGLPRRAGRRLAGVAARFRAAGVFFRPGALVLRGRDGAFLAAMTCFPSARLTRVP
jgi:hypothetical protein